MGFISAFDTGSYIIFFIQFGDNIQTARQLRIAIFAKFFDKSQMLLINFVCYFMRYHVIYFQYLCYFAVHIVSIDAFDTLCYRVFLLPLLFYNFLFLKLQFMRIKMLYVICYGDFHRGGEERGQMSDDRRPGIGRFINDGSKTSASFSMSIARGTSTLHGCTVCRRLIDIWKGSAWDDSCTSTVLWVETFHVLRVEGRAAGQS